VHEHHARTTQLRAVIDPNPSVIHVIRLTSVLRGAAPVAAAPAFGVAPAPVRWRWRRRRARGRPVGTFQERAPTVGGEGATSRIVPTRPSADVPPRWWRWRCAGDVPAGDRPALSRREPPRLAAKGRHPGLCPRGRPPTAAPRTRSAHPTRPPRRRARGRRAGTFQESAPAVGGEGGDVQDCAHEATRRQPPCAPRATHPRSKAAGDGRPRARTAKPRGRFDRSRPGQVSLSAVLRGLRRSLIGYAVRSCAAVQARSQIRTNETR
jgi:hypothetical protein